MTLRVRLALSLAIIAAVLIVAGFAIRMLVGRKRRS